ncbi:PREDICTED: serine/arginine repetitive matrix protein 2 [Ceratotherium simum simum]|uniref:Serine/arginine repetitive matrix protein 2 n=1 Tax=Ceratotherium simum simum TaxID=73337 RepID=A0ABM1DIT5_CERSS|nr:PREDICTED: serine/arginine repetitive matrix protein 2 [Ceratotherium simum simum]
MGVKNRFRKSWPTEKLILALSLEINSPRTVCARGSDPNLTVGSPLYLGPEAGDSRSRGCTGPPDSYAITFQMPRKGAPANWARDANRNHLAWPGCSQHARPSPGPANFPISPRAVWAAGSPSGGWDPRALSAFRPPPRWASGSSPARGVRKAGRGAAAGVQAVTLGEPRAARLPASLGGAHVQLPDGRAPSSSSSACSSSSCTSSASSASASAAASAGRPDCRAAAVVAARLCAAARFLGPAQRPALQHLPLVEMGRRSSDTEEESRSKRKKKHRRRSSSSSSSDSRTYSRKKGGRKSRSKSRSWSRDRQPRSHSYDRRRRHRSSSSSSYGSRRKRSRSRSRGRGKSYRIQRSRSKSRTRRSRSRPRPRSHSRSSERSSHRRTRSRSRDRERRKGRDKEKKEKEKDKGKDKELHNIKRGESGNIKAGLEHLPPAEQAKARLQLVLEAAGKC